MAQLRVAKLFTISTLTLLILAVLLVYASTNYFARSHAVYGTAEASQASLPQAYLELIELSQKEKKGLTFFVKGQTVAGVVVRAMGSEAVEVRSQTYSRVIVRLDSVDAVAMN